MAMRLSEIHPSTVHYPLALFPTSLVVDTLGHLSGNRTLASVGKWTMVAAAASSVVAGAFGLIAQEEVDLDPEGEAVLATHRTLNIGLIATMSAMAVFRAMKRKAPVRYLALGLGAFAVAGVSAYLGGKLVYTFGAGVVRSGGRPRGVKRTDRSVPGETVSAIVQAVGDVGRGVQRAAEDVARGELVPALKPS